MKRNLRVLVLLLPGLSLGSMAAGITGTWKAVMPQRDNVVRELVFKLRQNGRALTGVVVGMGGGETPISEGEADGAKFSFAVVGPRGKMICKGSVAGENLKIVQFRDGDPAHTRELTLTRE